MFKRTKDNRRPTESVQFKFIITFFLLIAALIVLLNTYPLITSRDLVFKEKESSLMSQASVISSSLSALDSLASDRVAQVMDLLDVSGYSRIVITDASSLVLYDTAEDTGAGKYAMFSEIARAIGGEQVFWSSFADGAFVSRAAMPVSSRGVIIGSVYICEYDTDQAALITGIQSRLSTISIAASIVALILVILFSRALTKRITRLAQAIRVVSGGDYAQRLVIEGNDELTELSSEFNILTERLETTEQQRRRFVSDASHELKTPLASIRLLSDSILQQEGMDIAMMREFVTDIGSEAERLQRTTDKLLTLSRLDDGIADSRGPIDLAEVVRSALRLLSLLAATRRVTITNKLEEGCIISASEDEAHQIILNLAENAIKYNVDGGSVYLTVRSEGTHVLLIVEDTGIGIPEADMPNIFSRFYRVDKARSREAGGSGLGLSIVKDAVGSLGGQIEVSHRDPNGTRFAVSFPSWIGKEDGE